jgi:hypothetical protein
MVRVCYSILTTPPNSCLLFSVLRSLTATATVMVMVVMEVATVAATVAVADMAAAGVVTVLVTPLAVTSAP